MMLKTTLNKRYPRSASPRAESNKPTPKRPGGQRRPARFIWIVIVAGLLISVALPWLLRIWVSWRAYDQIYTLDQAIPARDIAIVLGAGLRRDGSPTTVLRDRVTTAVDLYQAGTVNKLLMSGDNRTEFHNEPGAMRQLALQLGVPDEDVVLDFAGRRTYDSCFRARDIFVVEEAILITQRFHLDRAIYLCESLGVKAIGVAADQRPYRGLAWYNLRELGATVNAWLDINFLQPVPVLGEKLPINLPG